MLETRTAFFKKRRPIKILFLNNLKQRVEKKAVSLLKVEYFFTTWLWDFCRFSSGPRHLSEPTTLQNFTRKECKVHSIKYFSKLIVSLCQRPFWFTPINQNLHSNCFRLSQTKKLVSHAILPLQKQKCCGINCKTTSYIKCNWHRWHIAKGHLLYYPLQFCRNSNIDIIRFIRFVFSFIN